jgi:ubiquinone/menaquinone biosynthesis C-methylase UbiE
MSKANQKPSEVWKKWANWYKNLTEYAIPSPKEIDFQREYIKKHIDPNKEFKVLILGSTPRLRDLVSEFENCKVFLCDINPEMTFAMTELLETANPENETWIKASWLDMPLRDNEFDFVLGDFTYDNVPFEFHEQFMSEVHRVLKKDGVYLGRFFLFLDSHEPINFKKVYEGMGEITAEKLSTLWGVGTFFTVEPITRIVKVQDFVDHSKSLEIDFLEKSEEVSGIVEYYPFDKVWHSYNLKDFEKLTQKWFKIEESYSSDDNRMIEGYIDSVPVKALRKI